MPKPARRNWTREQTLVAFRLYCRTPFGKLHRLNPEIIALGTLLDRTPSAVGIKAVNFASLDPVQRERGIVALANVSGLDTQVWSEFEANPEAVAAEAEAAYERLSAVVPAELQPPSSEVPLIPDGPTDLERTVRVRRVQGFFRAAVLASYGSRCAVTGLDVPELLNASHIVPWSASVERRADPRNGLCLNALLDRTFDRGLISFADDLTVIVSDRLTQHPIADPLLAVGGLSGRKLTLPVRFAPDLAALAYHRERVFVG